MLDLKILETNWMDISMQWSGSHDVAKNAFDNLCSRYSHSSRHYHTLEHVENMLKLAQQYQGKLHSKESVYFATWFHDAVQCLRLDNETASALLATKILKALKAPGKIVDQVNHLILATKKHATNNKKTEKHDTSLFIDLDLAILGADQATYSRYMKNCRKEYRIPQWLYVKGRSKFLKSFLNRPYIFQTPQFREKFELSAKNNLTAELENYGD